MSEYLLLKNLNVQNANALSSPFTFGFPAVTAFLGLAHALQRQLTQIEGLAALRINGVGIVSHRFAMQDYQEGYNRVLRLTANPLDKDGSRPSFVEEGRCHLTVSLLLEVESLPIGAENELLRERLLPDLLLGRCKLAGGDILGLTRVEQLPNEKSSLRFLMPGYALLERRDLLRAAMQQGQDALDALHGLLQIRQQSTQDAQGKVEWQSSRAQAGWLVPIAVGFHALTPPMLAEQQRDAGTLHRFAESLVTLGEFVMPYRLQRLSDLIWRYQHRDDVYACVQQDDAVISTIV